MTTYDIVFLVCILLAALAGIALGFHMAYRLAEGRQREKNDGYSVRPKSAVPVRDVGRGGVEENTGIKENGEVDENVVGNKKEEEKKPRLRDRIKRKKKMSFSEFDCQFTGEDPTEKLERTRAEQDAAYNCLESRVEKN